MSAKKVALVLGVVFALVGVLGMMGTSIVGAHGMFMTNMTHDLVHLVSGLLLIFVALKSAGSAATVLKVLGVVYLLVAVLGFVMGGDMILGLIATNGADNLLHVVLGIVLLGAGFMVGNKPQPMAGGMGMGM